ncbi:VTT domain-containing protein [Flavobacterium agricola]|uniref:VTT domain-containing protein n=1 Tax=Flavobacterium agricola TaxID=2870839 RepID=A0ABY6M0F0_9FLAO|nr:VTT domain-containing protein [Flavobacterium agricola]UYW01200.1 VTT domain-containing protein [Flavobacterium agricola]
MSDFHIADLINPEFYINLEIGGVPIGIYVVLFIIFAETGLFAGFFLPGDSLLFLSGIYSTELLNTIYVIETDSPALTDFLNVTCVASLVALAGILGNTFGYWFGKKSGTYLYTKEDTFWFKKKYLIESKVFYDKHGGRAIVIARFLPIIRTFAPIIAGIVKMERKRFMFYNIISSILWAFTLIFAGHYLNEIFKSQFDINLKDFIEVIIIIIVIITTVPFVVNYFKRKKEIKNEEQNKE